jgi:cytochrome c-type biogenesis protein CcmH/NrfG
MVDSVPEVHNKRESSKLLPLQTPLPDPTRKPFLQGIAVPIFAVCGVLFLITKSSEVGQTSQTLALQNQALERQIDNITATKNNLTSLLQQQSTIVEQSQKVTTSYNELLNDLLKLSETDPEARSVVEKFNIKSGGNN